MVFNMKLCGFLGSGGRGDQTRLVHDKGGLVNVRDNVDGGVGVKDIVGFDFFTFERRGGLKGDSFPGTGTRTSRDDAAVLPLFVAVGFDTQEETTVIFQGVGMAADEGGHLGDAGVVGGGGCWGFCGGGTNEVYTLLRGCCWC